MTRLPRAREHTFACALFASLLSASAHASDLTINASTDLTAPVGSPLSVELTGNPNLGTIVMADFTAGPTVILGESIPLGISSTTIIVALGSTDGAGVHAFEVATSATPGLAGITLFAAGAVIDTNDPNGLDVSNNVQLTLTAAPVRQDAALAGNSLGTAPHFNFVRSFNTGTDIEVGIDPARVDVIDGESVDIYITAPQSAAEWDASPLLVDVSGDGPETTLLSDTSLSDNRFTVDTGTLNGVSGSRIGVGYDIVVDRNQNGLLDGDDFIDGYGDEPGLFVVHDLTQAGPYPVTERLYSGGNFLGQNLFYPSNVAALGPRPIVIVSHGNGHNYQWYDHIGNHLASYGFVVMSHQNNTFPGIESASTTTLTNTDYFLGNLDIIDGGVLEGLIAVDQMIWIGHSRGGEGVARAYDRIFDGSWNPAHYDLSDIRLVSSIAPTDFLGPNSANPHDANYHLWVGGADADVSGCASNNIAQSFHLHDRAENQRQSISLHGVGHGDFHNGGGSSVATGPCQVGRNATHTIMRGYILPLFDYHTTGNVASKDFLWRQWENFRPVGAPTSSCVVVDLMFREGVESGKRVLDDFQTQTSLAVASSGATVSSNLIGWTEGRFDDGNSTFSENSDPFNGFTLASGSDTSRGVVFRFDGNNSRLTYDLAASDRDWSEFDALSFRAAQSTRSALTQAAQGDLTFGVKITDVTGRTSTTSVGAYGGGVEQPYQRTSCGSGAGWGNEMETIRLSIPDFLATSPALNLSDIRELEFQFGPSHGNSQGFLGLDDIELTVD